MIVFVHVMELLLKNGWSSYRIRKEKILPEGTMTRIRNGCSINLTTVDTICRLCNCQPGDIMKYIPDKKEGKE